MCSSSPIQPNPTTCSPAGALTGESGQRLQAFLTAAGLTKKYLILRTVPVDTSDLSAAKRDALVDRPEVQTLHRHLIAALKAGNSGLALVLAVGRGAAEAGSIRCPQGLPIIPMKSFTETGSRADWQNALDQLSNSTYTKDIAAPTFASRPGAIRFRVRTSRTARRAGRAPPAPGAADRSTVRRASRQPTT